MEILWQLHSAETVSGVYLATVVAVAYQLLIDEMHPAFI